jgi:hypothetical protein
MEAGAVRPAMERLGRDSLAVLLVRAPRLDRFLLPEGPREAHPPEGWNQMGQLLGPPDSLSPNPGTGLDRVVSR